MVIELLNMKAIFLAITTNMDYQISEKVNLKTLLNLNNHKSKNVINKETNIKKLSFKEF